MRSGELARAGGVNVETLRYYERRGLLAEPPRLASGYREYPPEALSRLRLVKQAQALGLTLAEIAGLLTLRPHAEVTCGDMEARIRSKINELDSKLTALTSLRGSLERLLCECCDSRQAAAKCPALSQRHTSI
jgi:DNA-binding transcriptional MerR regulator